MGMTFDDRYFGHPIYIATKEWQKRKHHKKRINKKWLKRYGTYEDDGSIWMTKRTYEFFKEKVLER